MKLLVSKRDVPLFEVEIESFDMKDGADFFIGRNKDCHVPIDDPRVSRYHVKLQVSGKDVIAHNTSKDGFLRINGIDKSTETKLYNKDRITIFEWSILIDDLETFSDKFFDEQKEVYICYQNCLIDIEGF